MTSARLRIKNPEHLALDSRRVGERTQDVEDRAKAEFLARADRVPHGGVKDRREQEADARSIDASRHGLGSKIDLDRERLEYIGASAAARNRAVPMFGHGNTRPGRYEGDGGGNVEGPLAVAARATGIDQIRGPCLHPNGPGTHGAGGPGNFRRRFALHAQGGQ